MMLETLVTLLSTLPAEIPNPAPVQPPGTEGIAVVIGWAKWIGFAIAGVAIVIAAVRMMITNRRGEGGEHLGILGWILGGVILIGGGIGLISALAGF